MRDVRGRKMKKKGKEVQEAEGEMRGKKDHWSLWLFHIPKRLNSIISKDDKNLKYGLRTKNQTHLFQHENVKI